MKDCNFFTLDGVAVSRMAFTNAGCTSLWSSKWPKYSICGFLNSLYFFFQAEVHFLSTAEGVCQGCTDVPVLLVTNKSAKYANTSKMEGDELIPKGRQLTQKKILSVCWLLCTFLKHPPIGLLDMLMQGWSWKTLLLYLMKSSSIPGRG